MTKSFYFFLILRFYKLGFFYLQSLPLWGFYTVKTSLLHVPQDGFVDWYMHVYIYRWDIRPCHVTFWISVFEEKIILSWHFYLLLGGKHLQTRKPLFYYFIFKEKQLHCEKSSNLVFVILRGMTISWIPLITICYSPFTWRFIYSNIFHSISIYNGFLTLVNVDAITRVHLLACLNNFNSCFSV